MKFAFAHDTILLEQKKHNRRWFVIKDEFFRSSEFASTTEYQHFPAECYLKPTEENRLGPEQGNLGKEITTLQTTAKSTKDSTSKKGLIDKIFNSIKNIGVTASVATIAVVGATTLATTPTIQLTDLYVESTSVVYYVTVDELDMQNQYAMVISTGNQEIDSLPIEENGPYEHAVEGLKPEWEYTLSFVRTDEYLGKTVLMQQTFQTKPEEPPNQLPQPPPDLNYKLNVYEIALVGFNEINVFFTHENLDETCLTELVILCENGEQITVPVGISDWYNGYVKVYLGEECVSLGVTPVIRFENSQQFIEFETYSHIFTQTFDVDVMVNTSRNMVTFFPKVLSDDATQIWISDSNTGEIIYNQYLYNRIDYYYELPAENIANYTLYLTNDDGQKVSNNCNVTFDTSFSFDTEFTFNYKNPTDVGITYNSDGTINAYITTDFQADNPEIYYQIMLGNFRFSSREKTFCAIGLPNDTYGVVYNVLIDVDGISYSIFDVTPSGAINEFSLESVITATVSNNSVNLVIESYKINRIYLYTVRLESSTGEEIFVDELDWVFDSENQQCYVNVQFSEDFQYVDVFAVCIQSQETISQLQDYFGSMENEFSTTIYK